jgi:dihydrofolate synthase/folylpolyglutamate synthase
MSRGALSVACSVRRFRSVHVAGSKGKGTVVALVSAALQFAGHRCGTLTSPHVENVNERLRVQGAPVSDDALAAALENAMDARAAAARRNSAGGDASWFDVFIAASLWALAKEGASWAVVECGLGGRGDSTNVLCADVSVLTSVELEHTEVLGGTVEAIAREKAAIVSPGGTLVVGLAHGTAGASVAASVARERGAAALVIAPPSPAGAAASNVCTARAVLDELGRRGVRGAEGASLGGHLLEEPTVLALAQSMLPARLESARSSYGVELLLDGAHTAASAAALVQAVAGPTPPAAASSRLAPVLLLGLMADKDARAITAELGALHPVHAFCTSMGAGVLCSPPHQVAELLRAVTDCQVAAVDELDAALSKALAVAQERGTFVVVVGSLRLCGAVRSDPRVSMTAVQSFG